MDSKGLFITFEGGDGVGKSTHLRFLGDVIERHGVEVVRLREPGGTSIGEELRNVVLNPKNTEMCDECELLIYEAARAQIVAQTIRPALERGAVVLCDRFFDSTVAYQVYGRGLNKSFVEAANLFATNGIVPDRTILITSGNTTENLERATRRLGADRLENAGADFHDDVNRSFLAIAQENPDRFRVIDLQPKKSLTSQCVFRALSDLFPWMADMADDPAQFASLDVKKAVK